MKTHGLSLSLAHWLRNNPSPWFIGEVVISGSYELRHIRDLHVDLGQLRELRSCSELREMIRYGEDGNYRPVRGFSGLQSGWRFGLSNQSDLELALGWIYPLALAFWEKREAGNLPVTELKESAARQWGMERINQGGEERQIQRIMESVCQDKCLRCRLWAPASPVKHEISRIPLLCPEPCNYLMSKVRDSSGQAES